MRSRLLIATLSVALAVGAAASSTAQAEGPFYRKCPKGEGSKCASPERLKKGESVEITGSAGTFSASTGTQTMTCTSNKVKAGAKIIGSEPGTAGSSEQVAIYEGCTISGNGAKCKVANGGKVQGEPTIGTLAKENKTSVTGEKLLVSFRLVKGTVLVKLKFEGECTVQETAVEVAAGALLGVAAAIDLERACSAQEEKELTEKGAIELCKEGHAPVKLLENEAFQKVMLGDAPKTLIKTEFIEEGKTVNEVKVGWAAFGKKITQVVAHAAGSLSGVEAWGVFGA